jgi:SAM-dependent methyltransferase
MAAMIVSQLDIDNLAIIRKNVVEFMKRAAELYATHSGRLLDIAPQVHEGARPFFPASIIVETFDIDPATRSTYTGDICQRNDFLADQSFDYIVCTEVLEHTLQPFNAVNEMWRILRPGGRLFISTPFNFRIHGPLPDCWRFTEHGLRTLLTNFKIIELQAIATSNRDLMPIHYTVVAEK